METTQNTIPKSVKSIAWVLVLGAMAPLLDSTMMNIAIHNLVSDLNSSVDMVQWTITGYVLAMGIAVPFSSGLLNKFDGKYVFAAAEIFFALGSILSALSTNIQFLIAARIVQGFASGIIMPLLTTLLVQTAGAAVMGQIVATVGLPMILGPLVGPIIGGIIVKYLSWHWIFWVNVPVAAISLALILWKMPHYPAQNKVAKLDYVGILLLATTTTSMIYGIVKASKLANFTNQTTLTFLLIGFVALILYIVWAAFKKEQAVLPLKLFTHRSFNGAGLGMFIAGTVLNGAMFVLPLFFQDVFSYSVMAAGLALIPQGLGMLVSRPLTGKLTDKIGAKYVVLASLFITFIGTIPFFWIDQTTAFWLIAIVLFVRGIGAGGILTPLMADAYTGMAKTEIPAASIGSRIIQNIGSAFGSAFIATLITAYSTAHINTFKHAVASGKFQVAPAQMQAFMHQHLALIEVHAFQYGFLIISLAALVILLPTLLLTNKLHQA